jgi:hypothetical protein
MNNIDLERLVNLLPSSFVEQVHESGRTIADLRELTLDLQRPVVAYWQDRTSTSFETLIVTPKLLHEVTAQLGKFGPHSMLRSTAFPES